MRSPGDVTGVLERVGLAGLEDRLPSRLSGGAAAAGDGGPGPGVASGDGVRRRADGREIGRAHV